MLASRREKKMECSCHRREGKAAGEGKALREGKRASILKKAGGAGGEKKCS